MVAQKVSSWVFFFETKREAFCLLLNLFSAYMSQFPLQIYFCRVICGIIVLSRQQVDIPQNQRLCLGLSYSLFSPFKLGLVYFSFIFFSNLSRSSQNDSMDLIQSQFRSVLYGLLLIVSILYDFMNLYGTAVLFRFRFCLFWFWFIYQSNPSSVYCLMSLFMATAFILAMKLAWQTFGCVLAVLLQQSKQIYSTLCFLSEIELLILSMSMMRSIWRMVSSLSLSSQLAATCFWSISNFFQYWSSFSF